MCFRVLFDGNHCVLEYVWAHSTMLTTSLCVFPLLIRICGVRIVEPLFPVATKGIIVFRIGTKDKATQWIRIQVDEPIWDYTYSGCEHVVIQRFGLTFVW